MSDNRNVRDLLLCTFRRTSGDPVGVSAGDQDIGNRIAQTDDRFRFFGDRIVCQYHRIFVHIIALTSCERKKQHQR